jgi:hypothetical protein
MAGYWVPEVWCDICLERVPAESESTLRQLRSNLRENDGWTRQRTNDTGELQDLCPSCTAVVADVRHHPAEVEP